MLEIGPFNNPVLTGDHVRYFDVVDAEQIRAEAQRMSLAASRIPDRIHYVDGSGSLGSIDDKFSIVFSSHSIEHTFDVYGHLNEVANVLEGGGEYHLAIPDKRYCFDHFKDASTIGGAVEAFMNKPTDYPLKVWVDRVFIGTHNESARHWNGDHGSMNKSNLADRVGKAVEEYQSGYRYPMRPHMWAFYPENFADIMDVGYNLGYLKVPLKAVHETNRGANEFYAVFGH